MEKLGTYFKGEKIYYIKRSTFGPKDFRNLVIYIYFQTYDYYDE
jgi:hypothetical protein